MHFSLRRRLFVAMVGLGTLPLAVALLVLAFQVRSSVSPQGARAALDEIAESGRTLVNTVDTTRLTPAEAAALRRHTEAISRRTRLARRAETLTRTSAGVLGVVIVIVGAVVTLTSLGLARRWSRFISTPIEELIDWVGRVQRREALPATEAGGGPPEFDQLRDALRQMSDALERARSQELERARLHAFRETARRVAHEMRGPLSAARLALRQFERSADAGALSVLAEETERLEQMAREFSEFGRLPEGPEIDVDLSEMLERLVASSVGPGMVVNSEIPTGLTVRGTYEPLRRAFHNLIRNATEATDERGIALRARLADGCVEVQIRDHGAGVPPDDRERIFDPYFTTKKGGTGLGLAMVRQIVAGHGGTIEVREGDAGGAIFVVSLRGGE